RLDGGQIVTADAGMGVDDTKPLVLLLEILDQAAEHGVLDDIGEIAGVVGVAIVHADFILANRCDLIEGAGYSFFWSSLSPGFAALPRAASRIRSISSRSISRPRSKVLSNSVIRK